MFIVYYVHTCGRDACIGDGLHGGGGVDGNGGGDAIVLILEV